MVEGQPISQENNAPTEQLVCDLCAIVEKLGKQNETEREFRGQTVDPSIKLFLWASYNDPRILWVSTTPDDRAFGEIKTYDFNFGQVIWEKSLSFEDARQAVTKIQAKLNSDPTY